MENDAMLPRVVDVRFEHYRETLGIGHDRPRLSWRVVTAIPSWWQEAYRVRLLDERGHLKEETEWIISDQSVLVPWPFAPLRSRERRFVQIQVRGKDGSVSPWSALFGVEAGLLRPQDWKAKFITPAWDEDVSCGQPCPFLRCEFVLLRPISRARLYITALGVYEAYINGRVVGDQILAPGWTSYHHRLLYQTFDVTDFLRVGRNALGAILGDGWYRGRLGFGGGRRNIYGTRLALLAQLEVVSEDGMVEVIGTDESWRAATGPILSSDLYDGEVYDARLELGNWTEPGYDDRSWRPVRALLDVPFSILEAPLGPPVRRIEVRNPVAFSVSPERIIVDFGQNLVGRVRLRVRGQRGQVITLRHAEVLEGGELCTRTLRTAQATDVYILRGDGEETWEPRFTLHGFRYVEIRGWPGEFQSDHVQAVVCHSDLERTGWFSCSDALVNRLYENVVWSMRGNFVSVPTDCPQRDERLGWTGDIALFSRAAVFLYDVSGFLLSWLRDLALEQKERGGLVPLVVPNVLKTPPIAAAAWGDAAVIVPWVLYECSGDVEILARQFESMKGWVDAISEMVGERKLWQSGFQFGDWLDPSAPFDKPWEARTDPYLIATAYFAHSAAIVSQVASILGREEDAKKYGDLAAAIQEEFLKEYVTPSGRLVSDTQTAYALAIHFGLLREPEKRKRAGERLLELVRDREYRIGTGFVGTPIICHALCEVGLEDAAYKLFLQKECPSWLYPVTMGATTVWERWDSLRPDGTVNPGEMTSFNHYAFGAVIDWLHRFVGGVIPLEPGYRRVCIRPVPRAYFQWVSLRYCTPYGVLESRWLLKEGTFVVEVTVPPNARALVMLPGEEQPIEVGSGSYVWTRPWNNLNTSPSLETLVEDVAAEPKIWRRIVAVLKEFFPDWVYVEEALRSEKGRSLQSALKRLFGNGQILKKLEEVLREQEFQS